MKRENVRAELWVRTWNAVASSSNSVEAKTATNWADSMLKDFDKRFPEFKKPDHLKESAQKLREAQKAYMADRGNDELGKQVAAAAADLDLVLGGM